MAPVSTTRALARVVLAMSLASAVVVGVSTTSQAADPAPVRDGSTQERAAASCWEIKQVSPASPSGVYWLLTPQLVVPTQFYCDQSTDGGGWVLVGRGREHWDAEFEGKGTSAEVADPVTGQAAFATKQLSGDTITALLGGKRFDSFPDGVRIRRATNTAGTQWQETRFTFKSRDRWTWAFGAGHPIQSGTIGGSAFSNTTTYEFGTDNAYKRIWTYEHSRSGWIRGFNFGQRGLGTTSASSYIYSSVSGGQYGTPFSQVFIRPRITQADLTFAAIPDAGTAESTTTPVARSGALPGSWGVTGLGAGGTSENASEVQAFAQIGNVMYVGGNFTHVQKGANATGSNKVAQSYLAAFDASTGDYIASFTPTLNSHVKALAALPGGRLAVGGEFTQANGQDRRGLVVLDASTGQLDPSWTTDVENRVGAANGQVSVRALDFDGTHLYAGGYFTHFLYGSSAAYARNGARLKPTGEPDWNWNPDFNGTVAALDVSDDSSRVYFGGYFTTMKNGAEIAERGAAVSTAAGAPKAADWQPTFSTGSGSATYQQAIGQSGDLVWLGGSQHSMFSYDTSTFALENAHVTKTGGDMQAIEPTADVVYGACHCINWNYSDTTEYGTLTTTKTTATWSQGDKIGTVGAWDAHTGDYLPQFAPQTKSRAGLGAWALEVASDGTLWAGGTYESVVRENGANQWAGGFIRFAQRDASAPGAPSDLTAELAAGVADLRWTAGPESGVTYEVLRNDRVVATTTGTAAQVPNSAAGDRFFVRAADAAGNRSASTAKVVPASTTILLPAGSTWSYHAENVPVPADWKLPGFNATSWSSGAAPLGWGSPAIATNVLPDGTRALTSYYRTNVTVANPASSPGYSITTRADDGIVVYVNGHEVGRSNMPDGDVTRNTYALAPAPRTAEASASPVTFEVAPNLLVAGSNVIAVEVHSNFRNTPDTSMDLVFRATSEAVAPVFIPETLVAEGATWSYHVDNTVNLPNAWRKGTYDSSSWSTGAAPLGWGHASIATNVDVPAGQTRPLTSYFRHSFTVANPAAAAGYTLTTRADDGVVVYVNGVEVLRSNMPDGEITRNTYALAPAPSTAQAIANPVSVEIPPSALVAGVNVIAVEVHSNWRATPNLSMDLLLRSHD